MIARSVVRSVNKTNPNLRVEHMLQEELKLDNIEPQATDHSVTADDEDPLFKRYQPDESGKTKDTDTEQGQDKEKTTENAQPPEEHADSMPPAAPLLGGTRADKLIERIKLRKYSNAVRRKRKRYNEFNPTEEQKMY